MGRAKDAELIKDDNWQAVCEKNGWVCQICGSYPTDRGKPCGYENGLCPNCRDPKD